MKGLIQNTEQVRAILEGRRTQFRVPIKEQPKGLVLSQQEWYSRAMSGFDPYGNRPIGSCVLEELEETAPYSVGDVLYVRETFCIESNANIGSYPPPYDDGRPILRHWQEEYGDWWEQCHYKATDTEPELAYEDTDEPTCRWKPSIHMPKWAARLFLEITDVRAERVQDISEVDAKAEGFEAWIQYNYAPWPGDIERDWSAAEMFEEAWDSIYAKKGLGWESNFWVWAYTFKVIDKPEAES